MTQTLHEVRAKAGQSRKSNTLTDADYRLRDIGSEEDTAKNIIDITPAAYKKKPVAKRTTSKED